MEKIFKYSILRYVPEQHREEFINIGLVFHCPEDRYSNIRFTSNFSRVKTFDDELDIDFIKIVLDGMKEDFVRTSTISGPTEKELADKNFLDKSTMFYVNQLQFSPIRTMISYDIQKDEDDLFKTYVYFDVKKYKRIDRERVRSLLSRVFTENQKHIKFQKDVKVNTGVEDIQLDFVFSNEIANSTKKNILNSLSFDYASGREKNALSLAKEWHWNISKVKELKSQNRLLNSQLNGNSELEFTTFILSKNDAKPLNNAIDILSDVSKIIRVESEEEIIHKANSLVNKYYEV